MQGQQKYWILGVGAVLVVVAIFVFSKGKGTTTVKPTTSPKSSVSAGVSPSKTPAVSTAVKPVVTPVLDYGQAVQQYAGRRIQFDKTCQAIPNKITFKSGGSVMLDNRSGDARTVSLNGKPYVLAGYGFRIVALSSATLPFTYTLDCGGAQNVGTITIQK